MTGDRLAAARAELDAARARVPKVHCKGICTDACGPVGGGVFEMNLIRRAGVVIPPRKEGMRRLIASGGAYRCPALVDGDCAVYGDRPMVCRVWGASEMMPCPYGCKVDGPLLTRAETLWLIDAAMHVGLCEDAKPLEWWERSSDRSLEANKMFDALRPAAEPRTPKRR